jgi:hypothetical protein
MSFEGITWVHWLVLRFKEHVTQFKCFFLILFFGSATPCASPPPPQPYIFFRLFLSVHHLVNRDDQHLLAHAMASDFSVTWQCLSKTTIVFSLRIKLHALIRLGVSLPSLDTGARNGVLCESHQSH